MDKHELNRSDVFFDPAAIDRLAQDARQRRALYLKRHPGATFALVGSVVLISGVALLATTAFRHTSPKYQMRGGLYDSETRVSAATDQIENLKSTLESVSAVTPEMAREIRQHIAQAVYDCRQTPCSAPLQQRNYVARSQIIALLVRKTLPHEPRMAASR